MEGWLTNPNWKPKRLSVDGIVDAQLEYVVPDRPLTIVQQLLQNCRSGERSQNARWPGRHASPGARAHAVDSTVAELAALASGQKAPAKAAGLRRRLAKVRKTPSWPRSWANFNFLSLYPRRNAWANLHRLGQPNTFLA